MNLPLVVIVGRPNVGKSTLVNRLVGGREAITEERSGITRDRKELTAEWRGREFRIVDTGGWLSNEGESLEAKVSRQAEVAMREADVIVAVVDSVLGPIADDETMAGLLRRGKTPVVLSANKVDDQNRERELWAFDALGVGPAAPVSALHGRGSGDLLDTVVALLPPVPPVAPLETDSEFSVAIVGRPNVGKSTLFNRMVGAKRAIVHDEPGTTRDAIDTLVETDDGIVRFVDTAGMRRRSRIDDSAEYYSLVRALEAVDRANAAMLVVDANEGVSHQDQRLAERIDAAGTAIVVVLNKWDLVTDKQRREQVKVDVGDRLAFLAYAPVITVSALSGRDVKKLLPALQEARTALTTRVPTAALNRVLTAAQSAHPPPAKGKHRPRVLYGTQGAVDPPTFTLFATGRFPPTYLRYLEGRIRDEFHLDATPLKLRVRLRGGS